MKPNPLITKHIKDTFWNLSKGYTDKHKLEGTTPIWFGAYDIMNAHTEPFIAEDVAAEMVRTHLTPDKKYYGMSVDEILLMWSTKSDRAKSSGSNLDLFMQCLFHKKPVPPIDPTLSPEQIQKETELRKHGDFFYKKLCSSNIEFIGTELWVNETNFGFRGKMDALFFNPVTRTLLIVDHKQNEVITTENARGNLLNTLSDYEATDLNKLTFQLYGYRYALEKHLDFKVGSTVIAHYTEKEFKLIRPTIPYSEELMERVLEHTRNHIIKTKYAA